MTFKVLILAGDGIGPEVTQHARAVLDIVGPKLGGLEILEGDFGGVAHDRHGDPLPEQTLELALNCDATLLGAVGGPAYDTLPLKKRPEAGLLRLRKEMGVFANLRPVVVYPELIDSSSLRPEIIANLDIVIVRELIGGIYFSKPRGITSAAGEREGFNTMRYSTSEIRRIAKVAFALATARPGKRVCSVDKANVLEVSRLWREVVTEVAEDYPGIELEHMYVDNAAMQLVREPRTFDVILAGNIFGDILSDLAAELVGSIGMLPSASVGERRGLYEPIHGSAPMLAGKDMANPCASILSVALMLESSLDAKEMAAQVRSAVRIVLARGLRTPDLCRAGESGVSCSQMGKAICRQLEQLLGG